MIRFDNPTSQIVNCPIIRGDTRVLFQSSSDQVNLTNFYKTRLTNLSKYLQDQVNLPNTYKTRYPQEFIYLDPRILRKTSRYSIIPPEKYEVHGVVGTDVAFESELHVL